MTNDHIFLLMLHQFPLCLMLWNICETSWSLSLMLQQHYNNVIATTNKHSLNNLEFFSLEVKKEKKPQNSAYHVRSFSCHKTGDSFRKVTLL